MGNITDSTKDSLILYYMESCPFCQKVLRAIEEYGAEVELREIDKNPGYREELVKIEGGRSQVPCLIVKGKPMLESDIIVDFLKRLEER